MLQVADSQPKLHHRKLFGSLATAVGKPTF